MKYILMLCLIIPSLALAETTILSTEKHQDMMGFPAWYAEIEIDGEYFGWHEFGVEEVEEKGVFNEAKALAILAIHEPGLQKSMLARKISAITKKELFTELTAIKERLNTLEAIE